MAMNTDNLPKPKIEKLDVYSEPFGERRFFAKQNKIYVEATRELRVGDVLTIEHEDSAFLERICKDITTGFSRWHKFDSSILTLFGKIDKSDNGYKLSISYRGR